MKIKKRYYLQKKKLKKLINHLGNYSILIKPKSKVEILESDPYDIILVDGQPLVMTIENTYFPTLKGALELNINEKYVVVDMGAVKFVAKGADIMSPGIIEADPNIKEDDLVIVVDETHRKPLATGRSLISGPEMVKNNEGKAIKTIHYIGDKIWNLTI
ncbi:MAG: RNA-binding protein [Methanobacterium sp.]